MNENIPLAIYMKMIVFGLPVMIVCCGEIPTMHGYD